MTGSWADGETHHLVGTIGSVLDAGLSTDTEETQQEPSKPTPTVFKSWAHALGVTNATTTEAAKTAPAPAPPCDDSTALLAFEDAIQQALKDLDITAPAKEMKKRCDTVYRQVDGYSALLLTLALVQRPREPG